jgi:hypothetical protein
VTNEGDGYVRCSRSVSDLREQVVLHQTSTILRWCRNIVHSSEAWPRLVEGIEISNDDWQLPGTCGKLVGECRFDGTVVGSKQSRGLPGLYPTATNHSCRLPPTPRLDDMKLKTSKSYFTGVADSYDGTSNGHYAPTFVNNGLSCRRPKEVDISNLQNFNNSSAL